MQYLIKIDAQHNTRRLTRYIMQEADDSGEALIEAQENFLGSEPHHTIDRMRVLAKFYLDDVFEIGNPDLRTGAIL